MTIKEFFSFKENKYLWWNVIAMIVLAGLLIFLIMEGIDVYTQHGKSVLVPNLKGMNEEEAQMMLRNRGLDCVVVDSSYDKDKVSGCILEQNPSDGQNVKKGRIIYLTVNSLTMPMQTIPDVADNSSVRQATAKLISAGFILTDNESVSGERDWVYGVKYQGRQLMLGEKVPTGATLTLMVGNGMKEVIEEDSLDIEDNSNSETTTEPKNAEPDAGDSWF
ncbi:PASTA domain-containing protein [uncultured Bacteroides sp.]|uniref:PASTA domain-containing protein n=1 Tax=uncultured Bacteroides sp. TaxID=162156 RepID=UPI002AAC24D7|nr:PASTA domain-containing protein [uncultured Bacteroides sp.]